MIKYEASIIINASEYEHLKKVEEAIQSGGEFVITSPTSHVRIFNKEEATDELVRAINYWKAKVEYFEKKEYDKMLNKKWYNFW